MIGARIIAIIIVFLSLMLGLMLLTASLDNPVAKCTFNKSLNRLTLFKRVMWRLWKEETEEYSLKEIRAVKLRPYENKAILELKRENGKTINLGIETGTGQIAEIAEEISQCLKVPLQLYVGTQQITKYSRGELQTYPLLCSRCGGNFQQLVNK